MDHLTISITEEKRTLTVTVAYPELPINKIGTFVRHNFYFGTSVITPTDAYPEVIHTLWLPKEQTIEQNIIDVSTLATASSPTYTKKN